MDTTDNTGIAYFWIDDINYMPAKLYSSMADDITCWNGVTTELGEEEFEDAPLLLDTLKDLHYKITHIRILQIRGKRKVHAHCECQDTEKTRIIKSWCMFDVIELHFCAQIPIYIHESLIIDNTAPIDKQLPDYTRRELEEMLDLKDQQLEHEGYEGEGDEDEEGRFNNYTTSLLEQDLTDDEVKRIERTWKKFKSDKKSFKPDELKKLEEDLLKLEEFEPAAAVYRYRQEREKVTKE